MPRWVFSLGVGLLLMAVAFVVTCAVLGPSPGVTEANVKRINPGMTLTEVEGILGGGGRCMVTITEGGMDTSAYHWTGPRGEAHVLFDEAGVGRRTQSARSAAFHPVTGQGPLDRLRKAFTP